MCETESKVVSLNNEQRLAAEYKGKHLLVLAGAGTGKTRTIIARARCLIEHGVKENRILILSFTRKSAREIVERIRSELKGTVHGGLTGQTFHSWCCELIHSNPDVFSQAGYTLLDEDDVQSCFKMICGSGVYKDASGHFLYPTQVAGIFSFARNTKRSLSESMRIKLTGGRIPPAKLDAYIENSKSAYAEVIKKYIEYKNERGYFDYDDALNIVSSGLRNNREAREYIASKYDHILIDEMQDTNPLQYELLSNFYDKCHLFCVGDDAQSIYAFRGADFNSIHHFKEVVPEADVIRLTLNYRSTQEILDLSNWLLNCSNLSYNKNLISSRGTGNKPVIVHWNTPMEEANIITDKMIRSISSKGQTWHDHMVLSRTMNGLKQVEGCCIKKDIPYVIYGGISLMQSKHIRDLMSAIRIAANPHDELAWMRYFELWSGIGNVRASRLLEKVIHLNTLDEQIMTLSQENIPRGIAATLKCISKHTNEPAEAIRVCLREMESTLSSQYKDEWAYRKEDFPILIDIAANSTHIVEFVTDYIIEPKLAETMKESASGERDRVVLTTIHSAKGLEAKVCHIVNANPEAWPSPMSISGGPDAIEEERRCLYVAMTRAKDELWIYRDTRSIRAGGSSGYKHFSPKIPAHVRKRLEQKYNGKNSRTNLYFLNDLPENLYEHEMRCETKPSEQSEYSGTRIKDIVDFDFT